MGLFGKLFGSKQPAPPCAIHPSDESLVRKEDIEWWDSLSIDDCKAFEQQDNVTKVAAIQKFMEEDGLSEEEAARKVRSNFPFYYWSLEQRDDEFFSLSDSDAKLPYVLKDRINRALMAQKIDVQSLNQTSSFNARARQLIRSGSA